MPIFVPGRPSEAHLANSAEDPAERTKELILDEQETTLASRIWLQDLPEWVSEFTDNLVEPRSTSSRSDGRDPPEPPRPDPLPAKAPKRKHNLFTHFLKDPNCERASVRKLQEQLVDEVHKVTYSAQPSQERSLLPITKSSNGGGESRNNQRFAVAVQDVATQQIQPYSCKPKNITRNGKKSSKVSRSWRKSKGYVHRQFVGIWKSL